MEDGGDPSSVEDGGGGLPPGFGAAHALLKGIMCRISSIAGACLEGGLGSGVSAASGRPCFAALGCINEFELAEAELYQVTQWLRLHTCEGSEPVLVLAAFVDGVAEAVAKLKPAVAARLGRPGRALAPRGKAGWNSMADCLDRTGIDTGGGRR